MPACPICRRSVTWEANPYRPFCSERCRLVDLGRWLGEAYRIPGVRPGDASGADGDDDDER